MWFDLLQTRGGSYTDMQTPGVASFIYVYVASYTYTPGVASYPPAEGVELEAALEGEGEAEEAAMSLHPDHVLRLIFVELGGQDRDRTGQEAATPKILVPGKV